MQWLSNATPVLSSRRKPSPQPLTHSCPGQGSGAGFWQRPHAQTTLETWGKTWGERRRGSVWREWHLTKIYYHFPLKIFISSFTSLILNKITMFLSKIVKGFISYPNNWSLITKLWWFFYYLSTNSHSRS